MLSSDVMCDDPMCPADVPKDKNFAYQILPCN